MTDPATRPKSVAALAILVIFCAAIAACSKSTTTAGPADTAAATTAAANKTEKANTTARSGKSDTTGATRRAATSSTDGENGSDEGDDDVTTTSGRTSTSSGSGGSRSYTTITVTPSSGNEAFCNDLATGFNNLVSHLQAGDWTTEAEIIQAVTGWYKLAADSAPAEIKGDLEALITVFESSSSFQDIGTKVGTPELGQTAQHLGSWLQTNCGINPQLPIG